MNLEINFYFITLKLPEILVNSKEKCLGCPPAPPHLSRYESASCPCSVIPKCEVQALSIKCQSNELTSYFHPQSIRIRNLDAVICGLRIYHNCDKTWKCHLPFLNAKNGLNVEFIKKLKTLAYAVALQQLKGPMSVCLSVCGHFWTGRICFLL